MRCYIRPTEWPDGTFSLDQEETHHLLQVLRAKPGQQVGLFDGAGRTGVAEVLSTQGRKSAELQLLSEVVVPRPPLEVVLVQSVIREQKMDWVVQKATELGVTSIVPIITCNTVVQLKPDRLDTKKERWEKIALGAAKQCGVHWLPTVHPPQSFNDYMNTTPPAPGSLLCSLAAGAKPLRDVLRTLEQPSCLTALVGPEGDFTPEELQRLEKTGAISTTLGNSVLRAETAAMYVLSAIRYEYGL